MRHGWLCLGFTLAVLGSLPVAARAGVQEVVLHNFGPSPPGKLGAKPYAGLYRDAAGNLYGTTVNGGTSNLGVVYALDPAGHERVLHSFTRANGDGWYPYTGVIGDGAGNLYGTTTMGGGTFASGIVFKVDATGHETVLASLYNSPTSGLVRDSAGNLYGTALWGAFQAGVIYKIDPTGLGTILYNFTGGADGSGPNSLLRDPAGNLFGTTASGGAGKSGVIFKLDTTGRFSVVYYFVGADGSTPLSLTSDGAGNLYGVTASGGQNNFGVVFKVTPAGIEQVLYSFTGGSDAKPAPGVVRDAAGNLYGATTAYSTSGYPGEVYKIDPTGHETVLHSFSGGSDGSTPESGVILDPAGNLYGTTSLPGSGIVYKIDPTGQETVLSTFTANSADGAYPYSGVIADAANNLYGTTSSGGTAGLGTVYKFDAMGHETLLHSFMGGADGAFPWGALALDKAGNLYGTTTQGGSASNQGVVFKIDPSGEESVLYAFTGGTDGGQPFSGVVLDPAGNLYGTATAGGFGHGVVYKLDTSGHETVLYNFGGGFLGEYPYAGVTRDSAGNLYGTTLLGGTANVGIVYRLNAAGFTVLYSFTGFTDGASPYGGIALDAKGNLYGTTQKGGSNSEGVVFELDAAGNYTVLHTFFGDGQNPMAGVTLDSAGNLYGTTAMGGVHGRGAVYKLDTAGNATILYNFNTGVDGSGPQSVVIGRPGGIIIGTTAFGGADSGGTLFELKPASP